MQFPLNNQIMVIFKVIFNQGNKKGIFEVEKRENMICKKKNSKRNGVRQFGVILTE